MLFTQAVARLGKKSIGKKSFVSLDELEKAVFEPPAYFHKKIFNTPKLTDYLLVQYPAEKEVVRLS
ncbi:MAG: hypothetical protein ACYTXC_04375 [Nostoc sp.]